ncbi:MAG: hypothetical protein WBQ40_01895 [Candidatus Sulfotelmatobacter sp.]
MKTNDTDKSVSRIAGRGLVLVCLLAVALASAASSFAQSNAGTAPKAADAKAAQPSASSLTAKAAKAPRGTGEGIQIHGQWTIEIRNRDGSVARHLEFENSLVGDGPSVLALLLGGFAVPGSWELFLNGNPSPCSSSNSATGGVCALLVGGSALAANVNAATPCATSPAPVQSGTQPYCYLTLAPSLTGSSFTLSGQAYADTSTNIAAAGSQLAFCDGAPISPSQCAAETTFVVGSFSEYDFYPAVSSPSCGGSGQSLCEIQVQAGQVIAASVTFSFSSPSGDGQPATPALARPHPILRVPASTKPTASTPVTQ